MKYYKDKNENLYAFEKSEDADKNIYTEIGEEELKKIITKKNFKSEEELLNEAKELKINEINTKKENILNGGFSFKGKIYQSSNEDQLRINGAVTNALVNPNLIPYIDWIALDNSTTRFSVDEFKLFASSMAYFVQETIFKASALKEKARNAQSKEELDLIVWESEK